MSEGVFYEIYTKREDGRRGQLVERWDTLELTFRFNEPTKWTMKGSSGEGCPFGKRAGILIFRNGTPLLNGFMCKASEEFSADEDVFSWTAEGYDDLERLNARLVYPYPQDAYNLDANYYYTDSDVVTDAVLRLVECNAGEDALQERQVALMDTGKKPHLGENVQIESSFENVGGVAQSLMENTGFGMRAEWDGKSGRFKVVVYRARDLSDDVIFSVEHGNLKSWKRTWNAPGGNAIYAGGWTKTAKGADGATIYFPQQFVLLEDSDSIRDWGRHELYVDHSDDKPQEFEDGTVETDEQVLERLRSLAAQDLTENRAKESFSLSVLPLPRCQWREHWDVGDTVSVVIRGEKMKSTITQVGVTFSGGVETVTPTVGAIPRGTFESVFDALGNLDKRIKKKENSGRRVRVIRS